MALQFCLTVPAALLSAIIISIKPPLKLWTTFYSLTVALLDVLVLEQIQFSYRKTAAKTQELFDCELLNIEWNTTRSGVKPDTEEIVHAAARYRKKHPKMEKLLNWYPVSVGKVPQPLARLICQRTNCWWDSSLRKKYANILLLILIVIVIAVFSISLSENLKVEQMILTVYAPIAPAVLWSVREIHRQREAVGSLDTLRTHIDSVWTDAIKSKLTLQDLESESRRIQDIVLDSRSKNPMIFDFINNIIRSRHQVSMNAKAEEMVNEAIGSNSTSHFSGNRH